MNRGAGVSNAFNTCGSSYFLHLITLSAHNGYWTNLASIVVIFFSLATPTIFFFHLDLRRGLHSV